jgi:quercetin dioxygenase-like cupin family protein
MSVYYRRGCKLLAIIAGVTLDAQTPNNVKIDSEQARVLVVTEQPRHPSAMHEHKMNRVQIFLAAGKMTLTSPSGKVEKLEFKAGDVHWSPAGGQHISENPTGNPFQMVEIELKNAPQPKVKTSDLDPLKVDPKHYKLEFENDQVRVTRVRFGPHEKGVLHEHTMNHIVVYLTDQAKGRAGEMRLDGPETHSEENPLDHAVERLAIDLK